MDGFRVAASERFRVVRTLGEGATSRVFEVEERLQHGRFALKQLRSEYVSPERVARFKDEFRTFQHLSHPNLAKNYELIADAAGIYVLMELVDGVDFLRWVRPVSDPGAAPRALRTESYDSAVARPESRAVTFDGKLSESRLRATLPQLVSGLCALHAAGRVHCDIKPENVLVTREGRVVIIDFGLATRAVGGSGESRGTPEYMAPEQFAGIYSEAADWYALGVLLYCALTGRLPVACASYSLEHEKRHSRPIDPRIHISGLPDDLVRLSLRLLEADPRARPTAREIGRALGSPPHVATAIPVAFVGRERELLCLDEALRSVAHGACTVHVHGESGIGKTTLVQRFLATAEARGGCAVLRAACYADASVPYSGLDGIADSIAARVARTPGLLDRADRGALATMFPVFGGQEAQPTESDPALLRARAVRAFRRVLSRLAADSPSIVWIDDFQWTDSESIELLGDILQVPAPSGVLFVLSYRSHPERIGQHLPCDHDLSLAALDAAAVRTILEGDGPLPAPELEAFVAESAGNPFFVRELVHARAAGYRARSSTLHALLAARTADLPPAQRDCLELVSIAVRPLSEPALRCALTVSHDTALEVRRALIAASLIRVADNADRAIEPYHDRIREHVLQSLAPERSRQHHATLAAAYEASGLADAATLAIHHRAAGNLPQALACTIAAAEASQRALAFDHAAELYLAASELADVRSAHALRVKYAVALSNAGRPSDAADAFLAALAGAGPDVELQLSAGDEFLRAGAIDTGLALIRSVADSIGEPFPRAQWSALLSLCWNGLKLRRIRIAPRTELPAATVHRLTLCLSIARRLVMVEFVLAARFQLRYLQLALAAGSHEDIVQGLALQACFSAQMPAAIAGGLPRAEQLYEQATRLVRESDSTLARACVMFAPGAIALARGRWRECRLALEKVVSLLQEKSTVGLRWDAAFSQSVITQMLWLEGDLLELRQRMHGYLRESKGHLMAESVHVLRGSAMLALCDDRPERARELAAGTMKSWAERPWRMPHHFNCLTLNEIDLYEGKPLDALERQHATREHSRKAGFHQVALYLLLDTIVRARTTLAAGMYAEARRDIDMLRARDEGWAAAIGEALFASLSAAVGQPERASRSLASAIERLDAWQLGSFAGAARHRLGLLRADRDLQQRVCADFQQRGVAHPERFIASFLPWRDWP